MIYFCSRKQRRASVLASPHLNGIDFLEVLGKPGCGTELAVTFLKDPRPLSLRPENFLIQGTTPTRVVSLTQPTDSDPLLLTVQLDATGDFSMYTLTLVAGQDITEPPVGLDPQLSSLEFSFKAGCPSPADCQTGTCCPPAAHLTPDINYLAKEYDGFRQVMLDRIAVLVPGWNETHPADLGVALVETLAYAADHLSYQQDAVSTEAYLGTARSRISLRRHARLVDYRVGEGCNARSWVYLEATTDEVHLAKGTRFYVRTPGLPPVMSSLDGRVRQLLNSPHPVFVSLQDATLHLEQNEIDFYTWGDTDCCLPAGATEATVKGQLNSLEPGTVLIFEEVKGPLSGDPDDADPTHRWAVRLTEVTATDARQPPDSTGDRPPLTDPLTGDNITRIRWSTDDALPFPLCISSTSDSLHGSIPVSDVSVARGNVLATDHGIFIQGESLGIVPPAPAARFYPQLAQSPLTFSVPYDPTGSANAFMTPDITLAVAQIGVRSDDGQSWSAARDLLSSTAAEALFVPEIEQDGTAFLRFGDGTFGKAPDSGLNFFGTYRVGNGSIGNVGRDTLTHMVFDPDADPNLDPNSIRTVRNPLAATGGTDAESMEHVRQSAPFAFQSQQRCVTEDDYGQMTPQPGVIRQARGTLRWTGSWHTAFVSVDPVATLTPTLVSDTTRRLNLLRMMGVDLAVEGAIIVGLLIRMRICVAPDHFAQDVRAALLKLFINGLLNAANFTFGDTVYASPLIAAAQAVPGVVSASLTTLTRMDNPSIDGVALGFLSLGRLELARCDNDPNHLDHGRFEITLDGGK